MIFRLCTSSHEGDLPAAIAIICKGLSPQNRPLPFAVRRLVCTHIYPTIPHLRSQRNGPGNDQSSRLGARRRIKIILEDV